MEKVFICTNETQLIGAQISKYSFEKYSNKNVEIIQEENFKDYSQIYGKKYLRKGVLTEFFKEDLQSWTLLRFSPPEIMKYEGKALVVDPDVFLNKSSIDNLFSAVDGYSVACKRSNGKWASSVMVLNNKKLKDWKVSNIICSLINRKIDYRDLMNLEYQKSIVEFDDSWNKFDSMENAKILHTTNRITQPWRKGLRTKMVIDKMKPYMGFIPRDLIHFILCRPNKKYHREHPNNDVNKFFFKLMNYAINDGFIKESDVNYAIKMKNIRKDIWKVLKNYE